MPGQLGPDPAAAGGDFGRRGADGAGLLEFVREPLRAGIDGVQDLLPGGGPGDGQDPQAAADQGGDGLADRHLAQVQIGNHHVRLHGVELIRAGHRGQHGEARADEPEHEPIGVGRVVLHHGHADPHPLSHRRLPPRPGPADGPAAAR
jgi:hypothetical protein